jgi:hypothetical protein
MSMLPCGLGFGFALTLSADGNVLIAGAGGDSSNATGINGDSKNTMAFGTGAAHVFVRAGTTWSASNYIKASSQSSQFGAAMACSSDCKTLAIGGPYDNVGAGGINGSQAGAANNGGGAVYVY